MPEYLAPGVYIEEVSSGVRPIEGVGTSTTGFVGGTERGPTDPRFISSFAEFQRLYGGLVDPERNSYLPFAVRGFFENGGRRAFVVRVFKAAEAEGEEENPPPATGSAQLETAGDVTLELEAIGPGDWAQQVVAWVDNSGTPPDEDQPTPRFKLVVAYFGPQNGVTLGDSPAMNDVLDKASFVEQFDKLSVDPASSNSVLTVLKVGSNLVRARWVDGDGNPTTDTARPTNNVGGGTKLEGGAKAAKVDIQTLQGSSAQGETNPATGLKALEDVDEVAILCVPDQTTSEVAGPMIQQCEKLMDRFAVLNGAATWRQPGDFQNLLGQSSYAAVYHPWIRIYDPVIRDTRLIPPGGHVAGVFARVDTERGVHKAPANEILRGLYLRDVGREKALAHIVSRAEHERFNPDNINIIRDFRADGRGIRVYGARTLTDDPEWLYVSVRRLFIFVEESIEEGTQWVVFEPNHEPTWASVRRSITGFLLNVWRSGALVGRTAEEAFFVKCDRETMTQADIDAGRLICLIGIAPVKPAEFVIFRISQKTADAQS